LVAKEQENAAATSVLCIVWLLGRIHGMEKWVLVSQTLYPYGHFAQSVPNPICFSSCVHILPFFRLVQSIVCSICIFFFFFLQLKLDLSRLIVDVYSQHTIIHTHTHTTHTWQDSSERVIRSSQRTHQTQQMNIMSAAGFETAVSAIRRLQI
jgi:hypothetical protein